VIEVLRVLHVVAELVHLIRVLPNPWRWMIPAALILALFVAIAISTARTYRKSQQASDPGKNKS